jgi:Ca2+-binding RTX toxin-like protein
MVTNETTGFVHATLSEAIAQSARGDVLTLAAGSYREDVPDIVHSLTIRCVDGVAAISRATPLEVSGRAVLNVPGFLGVELTLIGLEVSGAKRPGPDTNGAGLLHESGNGNLTILRSTFHGNENGILVGGANSVTSPGGQVHVTIRDSRFYNNGAPVGSPYAAGGKCHNIYVNGATSLTIEDSHIHSVFSQGSQIKSRAALNIITGNLIEDLPQLTATRFGSSYSIDISNAGVAIIEGNTIAKGPYSVNRHFVQYGAEGIRYAENTLRIEGNAFVNERPDGATLLLNRLPFADAEGIAVVVQDNSFSGTAPYAFAGNIFSGSAADDVFAGRVGMADQMTGGPGNDTYFVADAGDRIVEVTGGGEDTVVTTLAAWTLPASVEHLVFAGEGDFRGVGNTLNNRISGGAGDDWLDGGTGNDVLTGGLGNDTYVTNTSLDVIVELPGEGHDTLRTTRTSVTLPDALEDLVYTGTAGFSGTGHAGANRITGGPGGDTLDGRGGADVLVGGAGNDTYRVDDPGDVVIEQPGGGTDLVRTTLAAFDLGALPDVENLSFSGTGAFAATGNAAANRLTGGTGADTLDGRAGADTLTGGTGLDVFIFRAGEAAGDLVTDFRGNGALAGDRLLFLGYGTEAEGARLTRLTTTEWQVVSADGLTAETIRFTGGPAIHASDISFA